MADIIFSNPPIWSSLLSAGGNLTLSNGTFTTTFNQTTNATWLWANTTTANAGTTNQSPAIELAANYWTGAASAQDLWTIQTSIASGTNGIVILDISHTGSSGNTYVTLAGLTGLQLNGVTQAIDFGSNPSWTLNLTDSSGTNTDVVLNWNASKVFSIIPAANNSTVLIQGRVAGTANKTGITLGNVATMSATSGTNIDVSLANDTWNPGSGTGAFQAVAITPTIKGTSSGNTTALLVNPTLTAGSLSGTNLILDLQSGGTSEFNINYSGVIAKYGATATVKNGVASTVASSLLTAQSAAITATTVYAIPAGKAGLYRITWEASITTAATTSCVLGGTNSFQIKFTNANGDTVVKTSNPTTAVVSATNATGTTINGVVSGYAGASTNLQYLFDYTSVGVTAMQFDLAVYVEYLG